MIEITAFSLVFLATYFGVEMFRRWSLRRELFDIPNERSSHKIPTPRGGGIIIVFITISAYLILGLMKYVELNWSFLLGSSLIALISWLDDLFSVSFIWRLAVHSMAAVIIVWNLGHFETVSLPYFETVELGIWGYVLTFAWIVWLTNAYNFMDGIDGIAGTQAVIAGLGWFIAGNLLGMNTTAVFAALIAFSTLGFLLHNWQPAKIFMGDVGSAFLGFGFAVMPFMSQVKDQTYKSFLPIYAVVFVWLFFFDTVYTFFRRLLQRKRVWEAHREHLYQKLVIRGYSHQTVTSIYGFLTLCGVFSTVTFLYFGNLNLIAVLLPIIVQSGIILIWAENGKKLT